MMLARIFLLGILLAVFGFGWQPAAAQEAAGAKVQPSIIEERIDPGGKFSTILHATNLGEETRVFYIVKRDISGLSPATGKPIFALPGEKTGLELSSWIEVSDTPIEIGPGQTRDIPLVINVPRNATPGAHIGSILLTTSPEKPRETGISIGYQVATIINLRISGETVEEARLREFLTDKEIYSRPMVKFSAKIENLGNVVVRPRGPIEITDFFGKKVAVLRMNDSAASILPQSVRSFDVDWVGEGLAFGRHEAVMSLVYGDDERKTISAVLSFWVLPMKLILPVIGGMLAFVILVFILAKLHIRRKLHELRSAIAQSARHSRLETFERTVFRRQRISIFPRVTFFLIGLLLLILITLAVIFFFFA